MTPHLRLALLATTAATLAEILLVTVYTLRMGPPGASLAAGALWAFVKVLPLLVLLPGLRRGSHRATTWLCFLLCGYFVGAVLTASLPPPARWVGIVEVLLVATGFTAGLLATRWARAAAAQSGVEPVTRS